MRKFCKTKKVTQIMRKQMVYYFEEKIILLKCLDTGS